MGKDAVPVVKQIAMARLVTDHLASLLQLPVGARLLALHLSQIVAQ